MTKVVLLLLLGMIVGITSRSASARCRRKRLSRRAPKPGRAPANEAHDFTSGV